jgi:hypothetical protein
MTANGPRVIRTNVARNPAFANNFHAAWLLDGRGAVDAPSRPRSSKDIVRNQPPTAAPLCKTAGPGLKNSELQSGEQRILAREQAILAPPALSPRAIEFNPWRWRRRKIADGGALWMGNKEAPEDGFATANAARGMHGLRRMALTRVRLSKISTRGGKNAFWQY